MRRAFALYVIPAEHIGGNRKGCPYIFWNICRDRACPCPPHRCPKPDPGNLKQAKESLNAGFRRHDQHWSNVIGYEWIWGMRLK